LPQPLLPLSQLRHQQLLLQPQQQVRQHQLRQKLRKTRKSLSKVSLLRKTQKPLLKQHQPQSQPLSNNELEDSDDFVIDDEVTFGRNRKAEEFGKIVREDELSDYVKVRLAVARAKAMEAYRNKWQS
jgi:hypothetical protein